MSEILHFPPVIHSFRDYDTIVHDTDQIQGTLLERLRTHGSLLDGELFEFLYQDEDGFKYLFTEQPIPEGSETRQHVIDEGSDLLWFFTASAHADGSTLEDIGKRMQVAVGAVSSTQVASPDLDGFQENIEANSAALPYFVKVADRPVYDEVEIDPSLNEEGQKLVRAVHNALARTEVSINKMLLESSPWQRHAEFPELFGKGLLSGLRYSVALVKAKGTGDWSDFEPINPECLEKFKEESIRYYIGVGVSYLTLLVKQSTGLSLHELAQYSAEKTIRRRDEGSTFDKSKR